MNFINQLSTLEYTYIGGFLLIYAFHFYKLRQAAVRLGRISRLVVFKFSLRATYLLLLLMALLGPIFGDTGNQVNALGKDVFMAVDLSKSMNATDVLPSRLERVKLELIRLVEQMNSHRIGLLVFSSEAFLYTPLTSDYQALRLFIQQLSTDMMAHGGTKLYQPLQLAVDKFEVVSNTHVKSVVLITDGEDFGELPDTTLAKLKQREIHPYFWIVGTEQGSPIPLRNGQFKADKTGVKVITRASAKPWQEVATQIGGQVFRLTQTQNDADKLRTVLASLQQTESNRLNLMIHNNRYYYFLWGALLLIAFDFLVVVQLLKI